MCDDDRTVERDGDGDGTTGDVEGIAVDDAAFDCVADNVVL